MTKAGFLIWWAKLMSWARTETVPFSVWHVISEFIFLAFTVWTEGWGIFQWIQWGDIQELTQCLVHTRTSRMIALVVCLLFSLLSSQRWFWTCSHTDDLVKLGGSQNRRTYVVVWVKKVPHRLMYWILGPWLLALFGKVVESLGRTSLAGGSMSLGMACESL